MLYTYECPTHGQFDCIRSIAEMKKKEKCPECGRKSRKVIVNGHGGIWRNDAEWVRGVNDVLNFDGLMRKPIETVTDLRNFLKENPNIKPKESHPALPSAVGDIKRLPTKKERFMKMKKEAMAYLVKDKALTINSQTSA